MEEKLYTKLNNITIYSKKELEMMFRHHKFFYCPDCRKEVKSDTWKIGVGNDRTYFIISGYCPEHGQVAERSVL